MKCATSFLSGSTSASAMSSGRSSRRRRRLGGPHGASPSFMSRRTRFIFRRLKPEPFPWSVNIPAAPCALRGSICCRIIQKNRPLIDNTVTVTGECFPKQSNLLVRVGTPISYIIDYLGGVPENAAKVVSGGPMMGKAISNLDAATLKGTSAILFLTEEQTRRQPETSCIRCGKCAEACPMGLEPFLLNKLARNGMMEELEQNAVQDCIECGCCLYSCPAYIPLLDTIRMAKGDVIKIIRSRTAPKK